MIAFLLLICFSNIHYVNKFYLCSWWFYSSTIQNPFYWWIYYSCTHDLPFHTDKVVIDGKFLAINFTQSPETAHWPFLHLVVWYRALWLRTSLAHSLANSFYYPLWPTTYPHPPQFPLIPLHFPLTPPNYPTLYFPLYVQIVILLIFWKNGWKPANAASYQVYLSSVEDNDSIINKCLRYFSSNTEDTG